MIFYIRMNTLTFRLKNYEMHCFKQNHDNFYAEHFEYKKILELIRRKY